MSHDPSTCEVCPDHPGEGWKVQGVTHCAECGATWRQGTNANHCKRCHLTFATLDAGYKQHTDRGHKAPTTMGLVCQDNRWGTPEWGTTEGFEARDRRACRSDEGRRVMKLRNPRGKVTCRYCGMQIHYGGGAWIDETDGDGCVAGGTHTPYPPTEPDWTI